MIDPGRQDSIAATVVSSITNSTSSNSPMDSGEDKPRVPTKDKKNQSKIHSSKKTKQNNELSNCSGANASVEVKNHLKSFICRKLQKEGKLE